MLWNEFRSYKSLATTLAPQSLAAAVGCMWSPADRERVTTAYPLISKRLARITVLPASSAEVESVFSAMKRIKTPSRNCLKTNTLDTLL